MKVYGQSLKTMLITDPPHHAQIQYAGQTMAWCSTDNEEAYKRNMRAVPSKKQLIANNWVDTPIEYKFNSHGYRTPEFEESNTRFMTLGCSFTSGIGLPLDNIWPTYLSNDLNIPVDNLGVLGASSGLVFRVASYWIPKLRPKFVVWQKTFEQRFEVINQYDESNVLSPINDSITGTEIFKNWWFNDINSLLDAKRNELAIRYICSEYQIPLFTCYIDDFRNPVQGISRDLIHSGPMNHRFVANSLAKQINKYYQEDKFYFKNC